MSIITFLQPLLKGKTQRKTQLLSPSAAIPQGRSEQKETTLFLTLPQLMESKFYHNWREKSVRSRQALPGVHNVRSAKISTPPPHETNVFASHSLRLTHILITSFSCCIPLKGLIFSSHLSQKEFLWIKETDESIFNIWAQVLQGAIKTSVSPALSLPSFLVNSFLLHLPYRNQSGPSPDRVLGPLAPSPAGLSALLQPPLLKAPRCRMQHFQKSFRMWGWGALGVGE